MPPKLIPEEDRIAMEHLSALNEILDVLDPGAFHLAVLPAQYYLRKQDLNEPSLRVFCSAHSASVPLSTLDTAQLVVIDQPYPDCVSDAPDAHPYIVFRDNLVTQIYNAIIDCVNWRVS